MKGRILDFSMHNNRGIISGDDHNRYEFAAAEWRESRPPQRGDYVDFAHDNAGHAQQIYLAGQSANPLHSINHQLERLSDPDKSEAQYTILDWTVKVLKNYANFAGRARRKEYWFFVLACMLAGIVANIIGALLGIGDSLSVLLNLALFVPSIAVAARRLHDTNRSGWWQLIALTIIGVIPLIIWLASDTKPQANQWGKPARPLLA